MSIDSAQLDLLLNKIEEDCSPSDYEPALLPFMFECADLVAQRMPKLAHDSLAIARNFAAKRCGAESVAEAVRACWEVLDKGQRSLQLEVPEVSAIRLVICILHREQHPDSEDFVDLGSFFLQLVNNVEPSYEKLEALLRKWFHQCI